MQDLIDILKEEGIEVPEEKKDGLRQKHSKNYKAVAEFERKVNSLTDQLTTANATITDLKSKTTDVDALNQRIKDYEKAEQDRKDAEDKAKKTQQLKTRFDALKGDRTYLNEGTESWMFSEFQKAVADQNNASKSDSEIYENITKDKSIFTPKNERFKNPSAGNSHHQTSDEAYLAEYYKNNPFFKK